MKFKLVLTQQRLIALAAAFLVVFYNQTFFRKVFDVYGLAEPNIYFVCSLAVFLFAAIVALLTLVSSKYTTKPILAVILVLAALASYFMDSYGAIIDESMLQNAIETDTAEVMDLFSLRFLLYFILLGLIPAILVLKAPMAYPSLRRGVIGKSITIAMSLVIIGAVMLAFGDSYASFIREHKQIRYYTNPLAFIYATIKYAKGFAANDEPLSLQTIGEDAAIPLTDIDRELVVMVVGETARADRFSLNGYSRITNPLLEKENVVSFGDFYSCGTSTSISVPCMFSNLGRDDYTKSKASGTENALDVLKHAGVNILWRDNNSSSKGVADRVTYEDFKSSKTNPDCDAECRDAGMLSGLQDYIDSTKSGDILIVLHQMGNHGPAYYKRYPKSFEIFKPTCNTNQLESCSAEEINNSYDNVILYTDYFLSEVIRLLKANAAAFEPALLYVSDHGESLGDNGLYLHGLPYPLAPDEQKHVAALMWFGDSFHIDVAAIRKKATQRFTHGNIFHTLLGIMEVETRVYDQTKDILSGNE